MFTFTVSRATSDNINVPITIPFTVGGTAVFGTDYTVNGATSFTTAQGSITLPSGQSSAAFTITSLPDSTGKPDQTIILTPQAQAGVFVAASGSSWTVTILKNGGTPPPPPVSPGTILLLRFQGADNSTAIIDSSSNPKTIQVFGNTKIINNQGVFDGTNSYLRIAKSEVNIAAHPLFTIEALYHLNVASRQNLVITYNAPFQSGNLALLTDVLSHGRGDIINFASTANVLTHLAYTYDGTVAKIFLNGILINSVAATHCDQGGDLFIGGSPGDPDIGSLWLNAQTIGLKISDSVLYTANFTPPTIF